MTDYAEYDHARLQIRVAEEGERVLVTWRGISDTRDPSLVLWPFLSELVSRLNEKLWFGHFDVWAEDGGILYRHAIPLPHGESLSPGQAAALIQAAREAGDRFYPAFQYLVWGGKSVEEAAQAAMFETAGEA